MHFSFRAGSASSAYDLLPFGISIASSPVLETRADAELRASAGVQLLCSSYVEPPERLSLTRPSNRRGDGKNPTPQCAFEMFLIKVSAIHNTSRSWLRSSSTQLSSDPPLRMRSI